MAGKTGWVKYPLDLAKAGEMLRDYAAPCDGDPIEAAVYYDRRGRYRRVTASYADGWRLQVNCTLGGKVSSYSLGFSSRGVVTK